MFNISACRKSDSLTLKLVGIFDFYSRISFLAAITNAKAQPLQQVTIDLTDVSYIDSAGLGLLMVMIKNWPGLYGSIDAVVSPGSHVHKVLELCHMSTHFPIHLAESPDLIVTT